MTTDGTHERLSAGEDDTKLPTERKFGITFAAVFAVIGLLPLVHGGAIRFWSLGVAAVFLVGAYFFPSALHPLNRAWFALGLLLHRIMNPVILGAMFYTVITPMAVLIRISGKRLLNLGFDPNAQTYWIIRTPPGPKAESVHRQF